MMRPPTDFVQCRDCQLVIANEDWYALARKQSTAPPCCPKCRCRRWSTPEKTPDEYGITSGLPAPDNQPGT